jgi:hypothetical protein
MSKLSLKEIEASIDRLPEEEQMQLLTQLMERHLPYTVTKAALPLMKPTPPTTQKSPQTAEHIEPPYTPVRLGGLWAGVQISPDDLAAMAADPQVQAELEQIAAEFAITEHDGLDRKPDGN